MLAIILKYANNFPLWIVHIPLSKNIIYHPLALIYSSKFRLTLLLISSSSFVLFVFAFWLNPTMLLL